QEQFDEAMASNDTACFSDPLFGELSAAAGLVMNPAGVSEALEHAGDRGGAHLEPGGDVGRPDLLVGAAKAGNRLQIVLHGRAEFGRHHRLAERTRKTPAGVFYRLSARLSQLLIGSSERWGAGSRHRCRRKAMRSIFSSFVGFRVCPRRAGKRK